jgi:MFS family permease
MSVSMTEPRQPDSPAGSMSRKRVLEAMSGLMMGMFVTILASTVVANALPRIVSELGGSQSSYTWVVTTELLAMTATVPLWGKLSDLYNKKLLIQLSLGLFVVGSLVAGFAGNIEILIGSRIAQGIGAGGLTALAQVIMASIVSPRELGKYSGIFGAVFAVGTIAGPLIGGVLVDTSWLGWRWCFFLGVPFAIAAILLLQRTLKLPTIRRNVKVDYLGAFLIMTGVSTLLVWSSLAGHQFAWGSWWTAGLVTAGLAILGVGVGMLMQNLVLVAQNDVDAHDLGTATSTLSFFRSLGGSIGVSALGAVLATRVTTLITEGLGPLPGGDSGGAVPNLASLPEPVANVIRDAYGVATSELFLISAPIALLVAVAVAFLKHTPLKTQSGNERLAEETVAA